MEENNKKRWFIVSDIHSFANEMKIALKAKGFDINNPEHTLIVLGDVFDRGPKTVEVYEFLKLIPDNRLILIRGNHETLFLDLLEKFDPDSYDFSNGTVRSMCHIANVDEKLMDPSYWRTRKFILGDSNINIKDEMHKTWQKIKRSVKKSEIYQWLLSDKWINYYEMDKYIFVHSFIPIKFIEGEFNKSWVEYYGFKSQQQYFDNWREEATDEDWKSAAWGCPYKNFDNGFFDKEKEEGKVLVCGHFHASAFHQHYEYDRDFVEEDDTIYYGKNLIAIDACTAKSLFCNVLVIDENMEIVNENKDYQNYYTIETVSVL